MADRIKLGGLWLNKARDGKEYLTGKLSPTVKILIFKNEYKTAENQPTHIMYLAPIEPDEANRPAAPSGSFFAGDATGVPPEDFEGGDDYIEEAPAPVAPTRPAPPSRQPVPETRSAPPQRPAQRPAAPEANAGARRPAPSRPAPPPANDFDDLEDPFAE